MKYAYIDIGTNSIRLLIVDDEIELVQCLKEVITTRIGAGVDATKILSEKGMADTISGLLTFKGILDKEGVNTCKVIATSAVRDATNRKQFVDRVSQETGFEVDVISGEEEARLGFLGLIDNRRPEENVLAIDIGGGSTELILGNKKQIERGVSIDIGAVRLTDKFVTTDPIVQDEIDKLISFIDHKLDEYLSEFVLDGVDCVIGIGGTISTMAAMKQNMTIYQRSKIHNSTVNVEDLYAIKNDLVTKTIEERKSIKGLQAKRADIILSGELILERIMMKIGKCEIIISEFDNLEGAHFNNS